MLPDRLESVGGVRQYPDVVCFTETSDAVPDSCVVVFGFCIDDRLDNPARRTAHSTAEVKWTLTYPPASVL